MYHIDRNNLLQLEVNDELIIHKGVPNNTLKALIHKLGGSPNDEDLIAILTSFRMDEKFPIKEEFNNWDPEKYQTEHKVFLHKYRIELVYEFVRVKYFRSQISRFEGFYLTQDPNSWIIHLRTISGSFLYEFEIINASLEEHDAYWPELSMEILDFEAIYNNAINYWKGERTKYFRSEILSVGILKVIKKYAISISV